MFSVINYGKTDLGSYVELSISIAVTHGRKPAPRLTPLLFRRRYGFGQFVVDLPVTTEYALKAGKEIFGLPKHLASLDFLVDDERVSSQYDMDGQLALRIDIARPTRRIFPLGLSTVSYSEFRGMLNRTFVFLTGKPAVSLMGAEATLLIGDHPRVAFLKELEISEKPVFAAFYPNISGIIDDHHESWFLRFSEPPTIAPEGLESVVNLGHSEVPMPPPDRDR